MAVPTQTKGAGSSRKTPATALALLAVLLSLPDIAQAEGFPTKVGACSETMISFVGRRLEGVVNPPYGQLVRICLVSLPADCLSGDDRGKVYATTNLRTGASWEMPDS